MHLATKLGRMMTFLEGLLPKNDMAFESCNLENIFELKTYLHYNNAYGHHSWQDGDLPWRTPTIKSQDLVISQNQVAN